MGENDVTLGRVDDSVKSAHKRIDGLESEVKDLRAFALALAKVDGKVDKVNNKVDNLSADMDEVKTDLKQVTARPAKWWDKLIAAAIGACASGIAAAILTQILK